MKPLFIIFLFSIHSISFSQDSNYFFKVCNIGDSIEKFKGIFYCQGIDQAFTDCPSGVWSYYPQKNDSTSFPVFKFNRVTISSDDHKLVKQIWLNKLYASDSSGNNFETLNMEFKFLREYLNRNMAVMEEYSREGLSDEGYIWRSYSISYVLRKFIQPGKRYGKRRTATISVKIY